MRADSQRAETGPFAIQLRIPEASEASPAVQKVGIIATKRLGGAVQRNRAKRRLRELFRLHRDALPPSCEVVLIARAGSLTMTMEELVIRYRKVLKRLERDRQPQTGAEPK